MSTATRNRVHPDVESPIAEVGEERRFRKAMRVPIFPIDDEVEDVVAGPSAGMRLVAEGPELTAATPTVVLPVRL